MEGNKTADDGESGTGGYPSESGGSATEGDLACVWGRRGAKKKKKG